jgi:hypothetical protein
MTSFITLPDTGKLSQSEIETGKPSPQLVETDHASTDSLQQLENVEPGHETPARKPSIANLSPADYIHEAQLLLSYASQKGIKVDNSVISDIVRAKHKLREGHWEPDLEIAFWGAFNQIANVVHPVSVASLKATYRLPETKQKTFKSRIMNKFFIHSPAEGTVFFYQIGSLFFLLLLLFVQTYWLMGSMRMTPVVELTQKLDSLNQEADKKYQLEGVNTLEINALNAKIEETQVRIFANYQMLSDWTWKSIWQPFGFFSPPEPDIEAHSPDLAIKIDILLQEKQFVLQIIKTYILPLLYGLLGAYAYVLIQISKEIKTLTYIEESKVNYRLRLQLGALSGLAVGWFINPNASAITDPSSLFIELSPLTLAFITGYSVDVLFALMDRLIYTFSSNESATSNLYKPITRTKVDS